MSLISRRLFGRTILAGVLLPTTKVRLPGQQQQVEAAPSPQVPDTIAGYTLSSEERTLATKFLGVHEKNMSPLRLNDLPNNLAPSFQFVSPNMKRSGGGRE